MASLSHVALSAHQPPRVVVIGAGFAGLALAHTLTSELGARVHVTVLESKSYIGGRAYAGKLPISGRAVELGATWFHGTAGHPLVDLARKEGRIGSMAPDPGPDILDALLDDQVDWRLSFMRPHHTEVLSGKSHDLSYEALMKYNSVFNECCTNSELQDASLGAALRRNFDECALSKGLPESDLDLYASAWHMAELLKRLEDAYASTDYGDLAFAREYEHLEGPHFPVLGGYGPLAQVLARGLDVRLGVRVSKIIWAEDVPGVRVMCENGEVHEADVAVLTASLGVLKARHLEMFQPALPPAKVEAINLMGFGNVDKVFVEWELTEEEAATWPEWPEMHEGRKVVRQYTFLWPTEPASLGTGGWIGEGVPQEVRLTELPSDLPAWLLGLHSIRFAPSPEWIRPLTTEEDAEYKGKRTIGAVMWVGGESATQLETLTPEELARHVCALVALFPALPLPPGARARVPAVIASAWGSDPDVRGAYAYISAGARGEHADMLGEPLRDAQGRLRVCFAGEATERHFMSTTHGAYFTGVREARNIMQQLEGSTGST